MSIDRPANFQTPPAQLWHSFVEPRYLETPHGDDLAYTRDTMPTSLPRIETANDMGLSRFKSIYLTDCSPKMIFPHPKSNEKYKIELSTSSTVAAADLEVCFNLVTSTSADTYKSSSLGWSPSKKRKEMRLPDLRYLLVKPTSDSPPEAFLSFMLTYEDGHEVIYCYEVHLSPLLQRSGLGKHLMHIMEGVGRAAEMEKSMLTVFTGNRDALSFYEKLGYEVDDYSPEPRKLRNGIVKKPDYVILSKPLSERVVIEG